MRFLALAAAICLLSSALAPLRAAEVRCSSGARGHYNMPQDEGWFRRRWPSGRRPTSSTCRSGFLFGPIQKGDYEQVRTLYGQNHPFFVQFILASPGGDVAEAIKIGRFLREYLVRAVAPIHTKWPGGTETSMLPADEPQCNLRHECICVGACALIWFGAVDRVGSVGLHLTQTDDPSFKTPSPTEDTNVYRWVHDAIRRYLDEMETPEPII